MNPFSCVIKVELGMIKKIEKQKERENYTLRISN